MRHDGRGGVAHGVRVTARRAGVDRARGEYVREQVARHHEIALTAVAAMTTG